MSCSALASWLPWLKMPGLGRWGCRVGEITLIVDGIGGDESVDEAESGGRMVGGWQRRWRRWWKGGGRVMAEEMEKQQVLKSGCGYWRARSL